MIVCNNIKMTYLTDVFESVRHACGVVLVCAFGVTTALYLDDFFFYRYLFFFFFVFFIFVVFVVVIVSFLFVFVIT